MIKTTVPIQTREPNACYILMAYKLGLLGFPEIELAILLILAIEISFKSLNKSGSLQNLLF
jgi:hypothetical protein